MMPYWKSMILDVQLWNEKKIKTYIYSVAHMTDEEITLCEVLYFCIDRQLIDEPMIRVFYDKMINTEMDAYVNWLVNRWPMLRKDENHLPKRFEKKYKTIYIEDGFEYMDKPFKQSIINWLSGYNSRQY